MSETPKRLSLIWPSLATIAVLGFGFVSMGLWLPALMMFDAPGSTENQALVAFALYSSAGPVVAILAVIIGWVRVIMKQRGSGLKWMLVIPLLWIAGLVGWLVFATAVCGDTFDCSA
ncbi:hypothetical protein [uncultured Maricaulis sp.]|uniref:hypothetical protein n=1 Tax=uncultured Maricaulis sp. TaxID=174710 RepID=UPI0026323E8A|nr:hypothetical protein [uncultured Maricaulis sp.]